MLALQQENREQRGRVVVVVVVGWGVSSRIAGEHNAIGDYNKDYQYLEYPPWKGQQI